MTRDFSDVKTLVVKVGTALLSGPSGFDDSVLADLVEDLGNLKQSRALNVLIVSSGAIGCGMNALGLTKRPTALPMQQATAAVGQSALMHHYETLFHQSGHNFVAAQVLLSTADLDSRRSYLNVRNTIKTLLDLGNVIPIINENDSVATEELKFGENDTLAAKMAVKIDADLLVLLSDVNGLYEKNPNQYPDANIITDVHAITPEIEALAGGAGTATSTGGMITKLAAAKIASASGVPMVIANGRKPHVIRNILNGKAKCTLFHPEGETMSHRKRWIAFGRTTQGTVHIDDGAVQALVEKGSSLLAAGITAVSGHFSEGAAVAIQDPHGQDIARGLTNYSSDDIRKIQTRHSRDIADILGRKDFDEVIHRDNLVLI